MLKYFFEVTAMTQSAIIENTISVLSKLPADKIAEVKDFADFVLKKHEEAVLQQGISQIVSDSKVFCFLADEEDLYAKEDLKVKFK
jgi:hypothetical protein